MSEENVELVRGVYERWGEGDLSASIDLFDPNVVLVLGPQFPDAGSYSGIEAIKAYTRGLLEPWTHFTIEAEEIVAGEDTVLVAVLQRGVGSTSGILTEFRYFQLWTFRDARVVRLQSIRERAEALEAAGLRE
jgi:ketosteroid isomerase-like protein